MTADRTDPVAAKVEPVHKVAQALSVAVDAARQGRPVRLDVDRLDALLEEAIAVLMIERRTEILKNLSVRTSQAHALLRGTLNGETGVDVAALVGELWSLRGALALVADRAGRNPA